MLDQVKIVIRTKDDLPSSLQSSRLFKNKPIIIRRQTGFTNQLYPYTNPLQTPQPEQTTNDSYRSTETQTFKEFQSAYQSA